MTKVRGKACIHVTFSADVETFAPSVTSCITSSLGAAVGKPRGGVTLSGDSLVTVRLSPEFLFFFLKHFKCNSRMMFLTLMQTGMPREQVDGK